MLRRFAELVGYRVRGRRRRGATMGRVRGESPPSLLIILGCIADYGWYFYREDLVVNVLQEAARTGGIKKTGHRGSGECLCCVHRRRQYGGDHRARRDRNHRRHDLVVDRTRALVGNALLLRDEMSPSISHPRFFGLVPTPSNIKVRVVALAQNLVTCS
jgi:hypothetical protein